MEYRIKPEETAKLDRYYKELSELKSVDVEETLMDNANEWYKEVIKHFSTHDVSPAMKKLIEDTCRDIAEQGASQCKEEAGEARVSNTSKIPPGLSFDELLSWIKQIYGQGTLPLYLYKHVNAEIIELIVEEGVLRHDLDRKTFERYWDGSGHTYHLSEAEFNEFRSLYENEYKKRHRSINELNKVLFSNGEEGYSFSFDMSIDQKFFYTFGTLTLFYNKQGKLIGLYDYYDFNIEPWRSSLSAQSLVFLVKFTEIMVSRGKPFRIKYGVEKANVFERTKHSWKLE